MLSPICWADRIRCCCRRSKVFRSVNEINVHTLERRLESGKMVQVSAQNRRRSAERFVEWDDEVWVSWRPRSGVVLGD